MRFSTPVSPMSDYDYNETADHKSTSIEKPRKAKKYITTRLTEDSFDSFPKREVIKNKRL